MPAVVLEGGSSRVAYSSGVCAALDAAGFVPDAVYGTSAGGVLGAWYGSGQAERGLAVWRIMQDRTVMSYRRALLGGPVFDLDNLYNDRYPERFGFELERLRGARPPIHATLTDADTGEALHVDVRKVERPFEPLRAGAAIPVLSRTPVLWEGRRYVDGGVADPVPLARAIADGHRDIVLVLNGPDAPRAPESALSVALVARRFPGLAAAMRRRHEAHNAAVRLARAPPEGVRVRIVRPSAPLAVTRTTRDPTRIEAAIRLGRADGAAGLASWARSAPG